MECLSFRLRGSYPLWLAFPHHSTNSIFCNSVVFRSYNPDTASCTGLGFSHFARHYSGNDLFSSGYLDVSVPQVPFTILCVQIVIQLVRSCGFPHSEIFGSAPVHGSPKLIAVSRVLHRQFAPRHPPLALSSFHVMRRIRNSFKFLLELSFKTWPTYYSVINVLSGGLLPFAG